MKTLFSLIFLVIATHTSFASTVVLKSGERFEGVIVNVSPGEIYFQSNSNILNFAYGNIREVTDFSDEEIQHGYREEVAQGLEASQFSVEEAQSFVTKEFSIEEIKEKLRSFKDFILERFSDRLKSDEKGVLESIDTALRTRPPEPIQPKGEVPTPEELVQMYTPYQSDLHDKILNLMLRYLDQWITDANNGNSSFENEERLITRVIGETRLAVLKTMLPSLESVRDTVKRYLANLAASRYAAEQALLAQR